MIATLATALMTLAGSHAWLRAMLTDQNALTGSLYQASIYSRTVIAISYFNDGFVRRGLGGSIAALLSPDWVTSAVLFTLFSTMWLATALALILYRLGQRSDLSVPIYFALVIILSPQTFLAWGIDIARTDMFVAGSIAWAVLATISGYRLCGVALLLVGFLGHETAVVFGAPLLACINLHAYRTNILTRPMVATIMLILIVGLGALMAGQASLSAPPDLLVDHMLQSGPHRTDDNTLLSKQIATYMLVSGLRGVRTSICYNTDFDPRYAINAMVCLLVAALYGFILPVRSRSGFLASVILPVCFMLLVAMDTGRWCQLAVLNAWLFAAAQRLQPNVKAGPMPAAASLAGATALLALLASGITHYDTVNRLTSFASTHLGVPQHGPLEQWLTRCDPQWRAVLAPNTPGAIAGPGAP